MKATLTTKKALYQLCQADVDERIRNAEQIMKDAQEAANQETKSSMGDKYETGRAMMQLEKDKARQQLAEAAKLEKVLHLVNPEKELDSVELGSLVITQAGNFYFAIATGKLELEGEVIYALSMSSPLGQALKGAKTGEERKLNARSYQIQAVI